MLLKKLNDATGVDTSNLATKKKFIALKVKVDKLDINQLIPSVLNDIKTKVVDLDVDNVKTVPIDFKKICDIVSKEVLEKTVYNKINTKKII